MLTINRTFGVADEKRKRSCSVVQLFSYQSHSLSLTESTLALTQQHMQNANHLSSGSESEQFKFFLDVFYRIQRKKHDIKK